jgi:hypothetical protein
MNELIEKIGPVECIVYLKGKFWRSFNTQHDAWVEIGKLVMGYNSEDVLSNNTYISLVTYTGGNISVLQAGRIIGREKRLWYEQLVGGEYDLFKEKVQDDWLIRRENKE